MATKIGGKREGAGRKPGSQNKVNTAVRERAEAGGIMPLDFMLEIMRRPNLPGAEPMQEIAHNNLRFEAAKAAAPYLHSKLASVELSGTNGGPIELTMDHITANPLSRIRVG